MFRHAGNPIFEISNFKFALPFASHGIFLAIFLSRRWPRPHPRNKNPKSAPSPPLSAWIPPNISSKSPTP